MTHDEDKGFEIEGLDADPAPAPTDEDLNDEPHAGGDEQTRRLPLEAVEDDPPAPEEGVADGYPDQESSPRNEPDEPEEYEEERAPLAPGLFWTLMPLVLFVMGSLAVITTQDRIGYSWDEAYYFEPAEDAALWAQKVFEGDTPFSQREIDLYWNEISEHPSFQKFLSGFSLITLGETIGPITAVRLPIALVFGASLALIFMMGRIAWGRPQGLVAALAYLAMPRVFGHAHFAAIETPFNFAMLMTMYCFLRGLDRRRWAAAAGVALGITLATKLNGFFVIPALLVWGQFFTRGRYVNNLFAMLTLGPAVFIGMWPWLWPDPIIRFLEYIAFHTQHQYTALFFEGQRWGYGNANAPWYYPSVIIGAATPVSVLGLAGIGIVGSVVGFRRRPAAVLFLLMGLVHWAVASAGTTPRYDGMRLLMPILPMVALMAGGGAHALIALARWASGGGGRKVETARPVALAVCGLLAIVGFEGAISSYRYYPYLLSYFNPLVGGIAGAEKRGFEITYWGEGVNKDVLATLNDPDVIPLGGSLMVHSLHEKCLQHYQRWGMLRKDIRIGGPPPFYAHIVQNRRGFFARQERALVELPYFRRIRAWSVQGVPIVMLYRTPGDTFERYWPRLELDGSIPPDALLPVEPESDDASTTPTQTP